MSGDFSVSIAASEEDLIALAQMASSSDISSHRGMELANSADTPGVEIIMLAAATIGAIARCVSVFIRERKRRISIFRPDAGWIDIENPTEEQVTRLIESTSTLHIKDAATHKDPNA